MPDARDHLAAADRVLRRVRDRSGKARPTIVRNAIPLPRRHVFDGQHHWQVGAPGTSRRQVREALRRGFEIEREYTVPEFTYHRFYVLRAV